MDFKMTTKPPKETAGAFNAPAVLHYYERVQWPLTLLLSFEFCSNSSTPLTHIDELEP
jgi:hypothetical protein